MRIKKYEELKDANRLLTESNVELEGKFEVLEDKYKRAEADFEENADRLLASKAQLKRCEENQKST